MNIELSGLIPLPLIEIPHKGSEIWEAESFLFKNRSYYYLYAASGKGKTSLLAILCGIRKDFKGKVYFDDEDISTFDDMRWSQIRKNSISCIFQGLELFNELSALDNIRLKNEQNNFKTEKEIHEMAEALQIDYFLNRKCGILSYGQKQRVAIIRALCQPMKYLFADEAFSHLDHHTGKMALDLMLNELKMQNAGLILTGLNEMKFSNLSKEVRL